MKETADFYLLDLGHHLREYWRDAEERYRSATGDERHFEDGRRRAYRQVLTLMLLQAEAFSLDPSALSLQGLDIDKDLGY